MAGQGGYIARIELENFMCHRKFRIDMHKEMNIIVGRNGSGKSAILTALIVGLGGGARSTSRGNSFRDLIRHGANDAFIIITIHNPPPLAPSMAKFGEKFTIQRRIGHKTNAWSIRNASTGNTISTSKGDVKYICNALGFQPDNILVMLNQENAKQFLVGATPRAKYDQLDKALSISAQYNMIREMEASFGSYKMQHELQLESKQLLHTERAHQQAWIEKAEAERSAADSASEFQAVLDWRQVQRKEAVLSNLQLEIKRLEQQLEVKEKESQEKVPQFEEKAQSEQPLLEEIDDLRSKVNDLEQQIQKVNQSAKPLEMAVKKMEGAKLEAEARHRATEKAFNELQQRAKPKPAIDIEEFERPLARAREQVPLIKNKLEAHEDAVDRLQASLEEARDEYKTVKDNLDQARSTVLSTETDLRNAEKTGASDPLTGFGPNAEGFRRLNRSIAAEKSWKTKPIGPLLTLVKASPECDRAAIAWAELQINSHAGLYWVQNIEDQRRLKQLQQQCQCYGATVLLWNAERFNYTPPQPRSGCKTFFQAVKIDDPFIERLLVDQAHIEDMIFCETSDAATRELDRGQVSSTFFADGDGWRKLSRRGNINDSQYLQRKRDQVKMAVAATSIDKIRETLNERINEEYTNVEHFEGRLAKARALIESFERDIRDRTQAIPACQRELLSVQATISDLIGKISAATAEPADEDQNELLIEEKKRQLRRDKAVLHNLDPQIERAQKPLLLNKSQAMDLARDKKLVEAQLSEKQKELVNLRSWLKMEENRLSRVSIEMDRYEQVLESKRRELRDLVSDHERLVQSALELAERPDLQKYKTKSDEELAKAITDILSKSSQLEQLSTELEARIAKRDQLTAEIDVHEEVSGRKARKVEEYSLHMKSRKSAMKKSLNTIVDRIMADYQTFIGERGFTGKLVVDPTERKLVATANPSSDTAGSSSRSANTLSGGEKSYTQISLLLSVWNNINTGLVAMDEYDVFMDEQFRAASMEALIRTITGKPAQGILITPQGLPRAVYDKYKDSDKFKVHNLEAPRP